MDSQANRKLREAEYLSYLNICLQKGEAVTAFPLGDKLKGITDIELTQMSKRLKGLARTPLT